MTAVRHTLHRLRQAAGSGTCAVALLVVTTAQSPALAQVEGEYYRNTLPEETFTDNGEVVYRINGGTVAAQGAWPSMVAIYHRNFQGGKMPMCGGSIIDGLNR
jgi:secreted trypsin-like serine protease